MSTLAGAGLAGAGGIGTAAGQTCAPGERRIEPGVCNGNPAIPGFEAYTFAENIGVDQKCVSRQLYVIGSGPPVILLHELPGLNENDLAAARRLAGKKYTVIAPLMFGTPGGKGETVHNLFNVCGPNDFACGEANVTSTHVCWLRRLCPLVRERWREGKGIGVIGMCLTGQFPIGMMTEPSVVAPVVCQPTTPVNLWTRFGWFTDERGLGLYPSDLAAAKRAADERNISILGLRYKGDWRCHKPRFERLADEFGQHFFRLDLPGSGHSTLAQEPCTAAFDEVFAFLDHRLRSTAEGDKPFPYRSKTLPESKREVTPPDLVCRHDGH